MRVPLLVSALVCLAAPAAEPAFVGKFKSVQAEVRKVHEIFGSENPLAQKDKLQPIAENGIQLIGETVDGIRTAIEEILSQLHGASLSKEDPKDPFFPFRMDHNTISLLRANVLSGN